MACDTNVIAAIALGSNLGDRAAHIAAGLIALAGLPRTRLILRSGVHQTEAVGEPGGADPGGPYLNAAAMIRTGLEPPDLLSRLQGIERGRGRDRTAEPRRWMPRTLDLDLIVYGDREIRDPGLSVPHPHVQERLFVLEPLAEIAPDLMVPGHGRVAELLEAAQRESQPATAG